MYFSVLEYYYVSNHVHFVMISSQDNVYSRFPKIYYLKSYYSSD